MSPNNTTSSPVTTVFGKWRRTSSLSSDVDLKAQTISGTRASFNLPSAPQPARATTAPTRTPESNDATDAVDDFFGVTRPLATRESRHDNHSLTSRFSAADDELPPPYAYGAEPPAYGSTTEPVTLAMYLFKFGFILPLFWVLGAIIFVSPLSPPADFEPTKTETERQELVERMRVVEVKWAKRCVWALGVLILATAIIAAIAVTIMKH